MVPTFATATLPDPTDARESPSARSTASQVAAVRARALSCLSSATSVTEILSTPAKDLNSLEKLPHLNEARRRNQLEFVRQWWLFRAGGWADLRALQGRKLWLDQLASRTESQTAYADARARGLARDIVPRVADCGTSAFALACGCRLIRGERKCRQWWLCPRCRKRRARKQQVRIEAALVLALARERERFDRDEDFIRWGPSKLDPKGAWVTRGKRRGKLKRKFRHMEGVLAGGYRRALRVQMIRLAVRHSGDLLADYRRVKASWSYLRRKMHHAWGCFPYVLVWEMTPGCDQLGHVHLHVVFIAPWRDWRRMRRWAIQGAGGAAYMEVPFFGASYRARDGRRVPYTAGNAARYLGKYVSKGVDLSDGFSPELAADTSATFYNQRTISSSHRFWVVVPSECPCCAMPFALIETPGVVWQDTREARAPPESAADWAMEIHDELSVWRARFAIGSRTS